MKELKCAICAFAADLAPLEALPGDICRLQRQLPSPPNIGREQHAGPLCLVSLRLPCWTAGAAAHLPAFLCACMHALSHASAPAFAAIEFARAIKELRKRAAAAAEEAQALMRSAAEATPLQVNADRLS